jgi:peptidyl-prolyl cis-trans isomerase SurA
MTVRPVIRCALLAGIVLASEQCLPQTRELGSSGDLLDGIAAVVDEGIVLESELAQRVAIVVGNLRAQQQEAPPEQRGPLPPLGVIERQVLDQLVLRQIQLQRADRVGIVVSDDQLNQVLGRLASNLGITLDELPAALAAENLDYSMYRENAREDILISQLEQRDVMNRIAVTPRELDQCLQRLEENQTNQFDYNVSHILVSLSASATSEETRDAERRINEIREQLASGADFAQLALTYSQAQTALQGGSLGWRKGSELPTLFAEVVFGLQPGEVSEPIQSGSGFHIVRLNEMRGAERVMVDQVHARHILIAPNALLDEDATRQKLIGIRDQILKGEDFTAVANAVSEDAVSGSDGGDLGWVSPDDFVPEFAEKLRDLQIGELSEVFRTRFGYHIVEVLDRRSHDTTDELKEERCLTEIRDGKAEEEREMWARRLRDQAYVCLKGIEAC